MRNILLCVLAVCTIMVPPHIRDGLLWIIASLALLNMLPKFVIARLHQLEIHLHEIAHGITSVVTGGKWNHHELNQQGGVCYTQGGNPTATSSAGYLSIILIGSILTAGAFLETPIYAIIAILGITLLLSCIKTGNSKTTIGSILLGLSLFSLSYACYLNPVFTKFIPTSIGCYLLIGGFKSLYHLLKISIYEPNENSDALHLAKLHNSHPTLCSLSLIVASIVICSSTILLAAG